MTRLRITRLAMLAATVVLTAGGLTACGGAPTDASTEDFCKTVNGVTRVQDAEDLHKLADRMDHTGTPEDMPKDARAGFELFVETAKDIDDDATREDIDDADQDFSAKEKRRINAFNTYVTTTCVPGESTPAG
jgi:hypothetical protein